MNRAECLDEAKRLITQDRQNTHGQPENGLRRIASLWSVYLGTEVTEVDVAMMMVLLKVARQSMNEVHLDNYVDVAGYAALAAELISPLSSDLGRLVQVAPVPILGA